MNGTCLPSLWAGGNVNGHSLQENGKLIKASRRLVGFGQRGGGFEVEGAFSSGVVSALIAGVLGGLLMVSAISAIYSSGIESGAYSIISRTPSSQRLTETITVLCSCR